MAKEIQPEKIKNKSVKKDYIFAVGRRREAVARVRLYKDVKEGVLWNDQKIEKGIIIINGKPIEQYFSTMSAKASYGEPFRVTNSLGQFAVTVKIEGGGMSSQLIAFIHGVSRALSLFDKEKFRPILKKKGFLTRDARVRQRRKVGMGGKSRRKRQSPKR